MMKVNGIGVTLSKDIAKNSSNVMGKMGNKKALMSRSTCKGLNDPCIINGTVGKQLSKLISK
jgi:hypothetical protein